MNRSKISPSERERQIISWQVCSECYRRSLGPKLGPEITTMLWRQHGVEYLIKGEETPRRTERNGGAELGRAPRKTGAINAHRRARASRQVRPIICRTEPNNASVIREIRVTR
jgi:hypothetical protein